MDSVVGTDCDEVPLERSCDEGGALTPGGSSANLVPEYMVSMTAGKVVGRVEGPM